LLKYITKIILALILLLLGCKSNQPFTPTDDSNTNFRGEIVGYKTISTYAPTALAFPAGNLGFPNLPAMNDSVTAISISYYTIDPENNKTLASGALIVPLTPKALPLLSLQHGTETLRYTAASISPLKSAEGFIGLLSGAMGYLTCIPDYLGFGQSTIMHPYHHAATSASATIDFLIAVKTFCTEKNINLNGQLFLGGYSEGGYVTMAMQRELEKNYQNEFPITASAPMAGAYDIKSTAKYLLSLDQYAHPAYLAFLLTTYNEVYKWHKLATIFKSPYAEKLPGLFNGTHSFEEIQAALTTKIDSLITKEFRQNLLEGKTAYIEEALLENTLLNWSPLAPIRLFHGKNDHTVPLQNSLTALDNLSPRSSQSITLIQLKGNHQTAALPSFVGAFYWFETFRNKGLK